MNGAWVVVPVKCFGRGKSRLAAALDPSGREALARSLCEHVLGVLASCEGVAGVVVATDCAVVERFAIARGAEVLRDESASRLSIIVDRALAVLAQRGARAALVLMSDLPLLAREDVARLLAALDTSPLVLAPDRADAGTNALGLAPPDRIGTCFGSERSFAEHRARAAQEGALVTVYRSEGTARDLDTPDDLALVPAYADVGARLRWKRNRSSRVSAA